MQGHEDISLAGVYDLHVRTVLLNQPSKDECYVQVNVFLLGDSAHGSCIMSAVSCVDNQRETFVGGSEHRRHTKHQEYDFKSHSFVFLSYHFNLHARALAVSAHGRIQLDDADGHFHDSRKIMEHVRADACCNSL